MRVLVMGSMGSAGSRYDMALSGMGVDHEGWDLRMGGACRPTGCTHAIVATPTDKHADTVEYILDEHTGIRHILVEKPLAETEQDAMEVVRMCEKSGVAVHCVCNWAFAAPGRILRPGGHKIFYRTPSLGHEALWMNACQLVFYAKDSDPDLGYSDLWVCSIDDTPLYYLDVCMGYRRMLDDWLNQGAKNMVDGVESVIMIRKARSWETRTKLPL